MDGKRPNGHWAECSNWMGEPTTVSIHHQRVAIVGIVAICRCSLAGDGHDGKLGPKELKTHSNQANINRNVTGPTSRIGGRSASVYILPLVSTIAATCNVRA